MSSPSFNFFFIWIVDGQSLIRFTIFSFSSLILYFSFFLYISCLTNVLSGVTIYEVLFEETIVIGLIFLNEAVAPILDANGLSVIDSRSVLFYLLCCFLPEFTYSRLYSSVKSKAELEGSSCDPYSSGRFNSLIFVKS